MTPIGVLLALFGSALFAINKGIGKQHVVDYERGMTVASVFVVVGVVLAILGKIT